MTTDDVKKDLRLSHSTLPEMRARLALLDAAISALQRYQGNPEEDLRVDVGVADSAAGVRSRPFLVARRDTHTEKAS
jgi:adenosine/AMP kinase